MISNHQKRDILNKILSSEEFSHSTKSQELLKYLFDASLRNYDLNEITIATEFFGKKTNFDPLEDASIRVYISHIRKRLAHYYLTEGNNDKIQIDIPKGKYAVRFRERKLTNIKSLKTRITKLIFPILTLLLLFTVAYLWFRNTQIQKKINIIPKDNPIWTEFLKSKTPTTIVIGDYFFLYYHRQDDHRRINVRDPKINSPEEFRDYLEKGQDNEKILHPLVHTYLRPNAIWGLVELLPILRTFESSFHIKLASELVWEDITSHNIIFLGTFKTMYILKPLLEKANIDFSIYPFHLHLYNEKGEEIQRFDHTMDFDTRKFIDYGLITKFIGPNNTTIMLITGFDQGGVIQASREISKPAFPVRLYEYNNTQLKKPFYFKAILGVKGFQRADLSSKIEYFDVLD